VYGILSVIWPRIEEITTNFAPSGVLEEDSRDANVWYRISGPRVLTWKSESISDKATVPMGVIPVLAPHADIKLQISFSG
jgi:hypothetical protein